MGFNVITKWVLGIVIGLMSFAIVPRVFASVLPEAQAGLTNISNTPGLPLATLFSPTGILVLALVVGLFITLLTLAFRQMSDSTGGK